MRPIATINPVIGDESFVAAFGRLPNEYDDPQLRVATHVSYASQLLRTDDPTRACTLDKLDAYIAAGKFPLGEARDGRAPTFIDRNATRCAVAHLIEHSVGVELAQAIDRDHHNDYVADMASDPRFVEWARTTGLTIDELRIIQPTYSYEPPKPPAHVWIEQFDQSVEIAASAGERPDRSTTGRAMVGGSFRVLDDRSQVDKWSFGCESNDAIGFSFDGGFDYRISTGVVAHRYYANTELDLGVGLRLDRYAPITTGLSVPIDVSIRYDFTSYLVGMHGGPRFGAIDRELGWTAGVAVTSLDGAANKKLSLTVSLDATRFQAETLYGVTLSLGTMVRRQPLPWLARD